MGHIKAKALCRGSSKRMLSQISGVPLYEQVRMQLRSELLSAGQPGDLLPTQQEIAAEMGASMITVKRAMHELAREGLVESIRGKGTVLRHIEVTDLHAGVSSWTESISATGETPQTAWVKIDRAEPSEQAHSLLKLSQSSGIVRVRRLRMVCKQPICLLSNELPDELVPGLSKKHLDNESLYNCLSRHFQVCPVQADEEVTARASTDEERQELGEDCETVLVVNRRTFMANGRPMELASMVANANRYRYQVQLFNRSYQA